MSDLADELNAKGKKLLEENEDSQHRLSNLQAKLHCHQNDQDPRTPVTKFQEQVN